MTKDGKPGGTEGISMKRKGNEDKIAKYKKDGYKEDVNIEENLANYKKSKRELVDLMKKVKVTTRGHKTALQDLLGMTSPKVLEDMYKQNPRGFHTMLQKMNNNMQRLSKADFMAEESESEAERRKKSAMKSMQKRVPRRMYDKPAYERDPNHYKKLNKEESCCEECKYEDVIEDAMIIENGEKKGVKLNNIIRTSENPNKKFKVYVRDPATKKIKVVRFGDPNMEIKRDDPNRRKNFRARHNCDNPGPKTKARYWSCKQWRGGAKVEN